MVVFYSECDENMGLNIRYYLITCVRPMQTQISCASAQRKYITLHVYANLGSALMDFKMRKKINLRNVTHENC